ncbi:MAG: isoprenyl transferase [Planctomycetota bacterium]|jgi:undecaprenyl diphosphate synthase|nr:isoprenyl transferase [Planctomycetota bacterium]MDP6761744.1 isoprenyl transferase [Planctomycetota bacterium]MDP6990945.1 isoprenyl transferase [Planctomycetota bacterium]
MASCPPSPIERPDLGGPFPEHVAVIMDGNGRWAQRQGLRRIFGHREGIASVREITTASARMGMESLTLYAFSVENWKRPRKEVEYLMRLLRRFLVAERDTLMDNGVRLMGIGRLDELPEDALGELRETEALTRENTGLLLRLALSYGSRTELADALRKVVADAAAGNLNPDDVDDHTLRDYLYDPQTPDPDLVIRTAGEMRLSNFLLWQASYSELYVTDVCWPQFREPDLLEALRAYAHRERRYGGLIDVQPPDRGSEKAV